MRRGQREAVLAAVCTTRCHPTADEIYEKLRKSHPNLSLGTVYRNLGALAQSGDILRVTVPESKDRFDFRLDKHEHMLCDVCGRVCDIDVTVTMVNREPEVTVKGYDLIFHGTCANCANIGIKEMAAASVS